MSGCPSSSNSACNTFVTVRGGDLTGPTPLVEKTKSEQLVEVCMYVGGCHFCLHPRHSQGKIEGFHVRKNRRVILLVSFAELSFFGLYRP